MYLTLEKLLTFSEDELKLVKSECWKNDKWRCDTVGIYNLTVEDYEHDLKLVTWSEEHGDPQIIVRLDEEINRVGDDYEFSLSIDI